MKQYNIGDKTHFKSDITGKLIECTIISKEGEYYMVDTPLGRPRMRFKALSFID